MNVWLWFAGCAGVWAIFSAISLFKFVDGIESEPTETRKVKRKRARKLLFASVLTMSLLLFYLAQHEEIVIKSQKAELRAIGFTNIGVTPKDVARVNLPNKPPSCILYLAKKGSTWRVSWPEDPSKEPIINAKDVSTRKGVKDWCGS